MTAAHDEASEPGVGATGLTRLRGLFGRALDVPPATRAAWLVAQVPDPAERAALERLLAADADAGNPLVGRLAVVVALGIADLHH